MKQIYYIYLITVATFPYPVATPTLAYRGSALRGRGRAVYNTIRSTAATPAAAAATAVPAYPGYVAQTLVPAAVVQVMPSHCWTSWPFVHQGGVSGWTVRGWRLCKEDTAYTFPSWDLTCCYKLDAFVCLFSQGAYPAAYRVAQSASAATATYSDR